jgi:hypothetical protein
MKCLKCGGKYCRTPICKDCGFVPLLEEKKEKIKDVINALINELPDKKYNAYYERLKELEVL